MLVCVQRGGKRILSCEGAPPVPAARKTKRAASHFPLTRTCDELALRAERLWPAGRAALHPVGGYCFFATVSMSWFFTGFTVALCFSTAAVIFAMMSG